MKTGMIVSTQASAMLEDIARAAQTSLWFQLYIQPDRDFTRALVKRGRKHAGYRALVVTVDAPVNGMRNREQRAGFRLPPGIEAVNLRGMHQPAEPAGDADTLLLGGLRCWQSAPTWTDLARLRSLTLAAHPGQGGIMTPDDADRAIAEGMDGIIVASITAAARSTRLPATIDVLPQIAKKVSGRVPLLCRRRHPARQRCLQERSRWAHSPC